MSDLATLADTLNRTVKLAVDTGEADSVEAAERLFRGYKMQILVGADVVENAVLRAALLTAVNCAARTLLGGVTVVGAGAHADAVVALGATLEDAPRLDAPALLIGDVDAHGEWATALRVMVSNWSGGVSPARSGLRLNDKSDCAIAGVLAGALGVSEVFQALRGSAKAGRHGVGFDLADIKGDWTKPKETPALDRLPSDLWLVGLGNLGQAYIWTLLQLPYGDRGPRLVLQDTDTVGASNLSTSLLTTPPMLGVRKTRAMAAVIEARRGRAAIIERAFESSLRIGPDDPSVCLAGVDNALARQALEDVGFERVIEAGLGKGPEDYLGFNIHTFPAEKSAREIWSSAGPGSADISAPAYQALLRNTNDRCGVVQLAGRSIGAPFVGAAAAAFVIAELLKIVLNMQRTEMVSCHLREPANRLVVNGEVWPTLNPGLIRAAV
jgi:hypothetical protein